MGFMLPNMLKKMKILIQSDHNSSSWNRFPWSLCTSAQNMVNLNTEELVKQKMPGPHKRND